MSWAACTIAAKARLPSARVVARSFAEHHPGVPCFVLLADEVEGCFDPAAEPYDLLGLDVLNAFRQKYSTWAATVDEWEPVTTSVNFD